MYIPLKQAGKHFPVKPHYSTLLRWCHEGVWVKELQRYARLRTERQGRLRFTTLEYIDQFKREMNGDDS